MAKVDEKDVEILKRLEENSRVGWAEIGKALNLSEAAVRKRVKKLLEEGIIKAFTVSVDYLKLGKVVSITGINVKSENLLDVVEKIKDLNFVKELWLCSGDHEVIAKIVTKNYKELEGVLEKIKTMQGVENVYPAVVLKKIK